MLVIEGSTPTPMKQGERQPVSKFSCVISCSHPFVWNFAVIFWQFLLSIKKAHRRYYNSINAFHKICKAIENFSKTCKVLEWKEAAVLKKMRSWIAFDCSFSITSLKSSSCFPNNTKTINPHLIAAYKLLMFNWINSFPFAVCFCSTPNIMWYQTLQTIKIEKAPVRENPVIHKQLLCDAVFAICSVSFLEKNHKLLLLLGFPPVLHSLLTYSSKRFFPTDSFPVDT